jgi:hypothetical protein
MSSSTSNVEQTCLTNLGIPYWPQHSLLEQMQTNHHPKNHSTITGKKPFHQYINKTIPP